MILYLLCLWALEPVKEQFITYDFEKYPVWRYDLGTAVRNAAERNAAEERGDALEKDYSPSHRRRLGGGELEHK
jgi:hypothetical protein